MSIILLYLGIICYYCIYFYTKREIMTFVDILQKLLPFTYIESNKVYFGFSKLGVADGIITGFELFLLFIFGYSLIKLGSSYSKNRENINKLKQSLKEYSTYNQLVEDISTNQTLKTIWDNFDKTLIKHNDGENFTLKSSVDIEYFFNKKSLIKSSKLFDVIPGVLLGIGLLGTFFGLYFALVQVDMSNQENLKNSIEILINMAGVKFAASIFGLGLSIIFNFLYKFLISNLEEKILEIQMLVNGLFPKQVAEKNLNDIRYQNEEQTAVLKTLATSLTEKIATEFSKTFLPQMELLNSQFASIPQQISQSINETFQKPLEKLSSTVETITSNQTEKSNEVMQNILQEFMKELKSSAGDEGEKLKNISKQSQEILMQTSSQLQETFKSMQQSFEHQQTVTKARDEQILKDLSQIKQDQKEMIDNISLNVKENIEQLSKVVEDTTIRQQKSIQNIEEQTTTKMYDMLSNIDNNISLSNQATKEMFEKLIIQFDNHIDKVKSNIDSILINLKTEVQNIDSILSSTSQKLISVPSYLDNISKSSDKLLSFGNDLANSINTLLKFNDNFKDTQENLTQYTQHLLTASKKLELADTNLKDTLEISKVLFKDMKTQFSDLAEKNSDTIDEFGKKVDKFMNDYHQQVERNIKDNIIHQLDNALYGYAETMGEAITTLSDAIDELREKKIK